MSKILWMIGFHPCLHNATQFQKMNVYTKIRILPKFHLLPADWLLMGEALMGHAGGVPSCGIA
jgi:hypothetical protein